MGEKITLTDQELNRVIEMAWEDRTPFEAIQFQFGPPLKLITLTCPSNLKIEPNTKGFPEITAASLVKYRVGKLSEPSTIMSYSANSLRTFRLLRNYLNHPFSNVT